jgi:hypothetical protein
MSIFIGEVVIISLSGLVPVYPSGMSTGAFLIVPPVLLPTAPPDVSPPEKRTDQGSGEVVTTGSGPVAGIERQQQSFCDDSYRICRVSLR